MSRYSRSPGLPNVMADVLRIMADRPVPLWTTMTGRIAHYDRGCGRLHNHPLVAAAPVPFKDLAPYRADTCGTCTPTLTAAEVSYLRVGETIWKARQAAEARTEPRDSGRREPAWVDSLAGIAPQPRVTVADLDDLLTALDATGALSADGPAVTMGVPDEVNGHPWAQDVADLAAEVEEQLLAAFDTAARASRGPGELVIARAVFVALMNYSPLDWDERDVLGAVRRDVELVCASLQDVEDVQERGYDMPALMSWAWGKALAAGRPAGKTRAKATIDALQESLQWYIDSPTLRRAIALASDQLDAVAEKWIAAIRALPARDVHVKLYRDRRPTIAEQTVRALLKEPLARHSTPDKHGWYVLEVDLPNAPGYVWALLAPDREVLDALEAAPEVQPSRQQRPRPRR